MRQSTRSAGSTATTGSTAPTKRRCIRVELINKQNMCISIEGRKSRVQEVFQGVCCLANIRETEYFGLATMSDDELEFLDPKTEIRKLVSKSVWREAKKTEKPFMTLHFCVQFYADHIHHIRERSTRMLFYHQLKSNWLKFGQMLGEDQCFLLAAFALQAELGSYASQSLQEGYFDPKQFLPPWMVEKHGLDFIQLHLPTLHKDLGKLPRLEAAMRFIRELTNHPVTHYMHLHKVARSKDEPLGSALMGVGPTGLELYEKRNGFLNLLSNFHWSDIENLQNEKKKFEVTVAGVTGKRKFVYFVGNDNRGCQLLSLCRNTHMFRLNQEPKIAEQRRLAEEDKKQRELYIHSNGLRESLLKTKFASMPVQRNSSNASSNTTSGIASERLHTSLEESETDSLSKEIHPAQNQSSKAAVRAASPLEKEVLQSPFQSPSTKTPTIGTPAPTEEPATQPAVAPQPANAYIEKSSRVSIMTASSNPVVQMGTSPHHYTGSSDGSYLPTDQYSPYWSGAVGGYYTPVTVGQYDPTFSHAVQTIGTTSYPVPQQYPAPAHLYYAPPTTAQSYPYSELTHHTNVHFHHTPWEGPEKLTVQQGYYQFPASHLPVDGNTGRPNRSNSQVQPPPRTNLPPRAASNADALVSKRANCPVHGIRRQLLKELENQKRQSTDKSKGNNLPMLTALLNDQSMNSMLCTCDKGALSLSKQDKAEELGEPAVMKRHNQNVLPAARPVSWHSDTFNVDNYFHNGAVPNYVHVPPNSIVAGTFNGPYNGANIQTNQQWDAPREFGCEDSGFTVHSNRLVPGYEHIISGQFRNTALHQSLECLDQSNYIPYTYELSPPTPVTMLSRSVDNLFETYPVIYPNQQYSH